MDIFGHPNPAGSPNEKVEIPRKTWPTMSVQEWERLLRAEGVEPEMARKLSRAFSNASVMQAYSEHDNYRAFEHWANTHTHPGVGGNGVVFDPGDTKIAVSCDNNTAYILDNTGQIEWQESLGFRPRDAAFGPDRDVVFAGDDGNIIVFDKDGNEKWSKSFTSSNVWGVAMDGDGNVYTAAWDNTLRKFDSNGDEEWEFASFGSHVGDVSVDKDGFSYAASSDGTIRKVSPDGQQVWQNDDPTAQAISVAVNDVGYVYAGGLASTIGDRFYMRINPDGTTDWYREDLPSRPRGIAVSDLELVYLALESGNLWRIEPDSGDDIWQVNLDAGFDVGINVEGNAYVTGDEEVRKYESDGTLVWTSVGFPDRIQRIDVSPGKFYISQGLYSVST